MPATPRAERLSTSTPALTQSSSNARRFGVSGSSSSRDASPTTIEIERTGGGASRLARRSQSEPHWAANAQAADSVPYRREISSSVGSRTSSTERSTERKASAASIAASARSRS